MFERARYFSLLMEKNKTLITRSSWPNQPDNLKLTEDNFKATCSFLSKQVTSHQQERRTRHSSPGPADQTSRMCWNKQHLSKPVSSRRWGRRTGGSSLGPTDWPSLICCNKQKETLDQVVCVWVSQVLLATGGEEQDACHWSSWLNQPDMLQYNRW